MSVDLWTCIETKHGVSLLARNMGYSPWVLKDRKGLSAWPLLLFTFSNSSAFITVLLS